LEIKTDFQGFGIKPEILRTIKEQGFEKPTDIQEKAIPVLLDYEGDFIGQAQTGTGKTVAYIIPLLQKLDPSSHKLQSLILAPTRELANQVNTEIQKFAKYLGIKSVAVFGGASIENQIRSIKKDKPQIIVGTPGRVMDFIRQKILKFDFAQNVILDEADEMLNMGFLEEVQKIISFFKKDKKIWMFSATMPRPILNLIKKDFSEPKIIETKSKSLSNKDIEQRYYLVKEKYYEEALCQLIDMEPDMYGLVFCKTRLETKNLADKLFNRGYSVESLRGDMNQSQRDLAMAKFKNRKVRLMICTDVASRGIDVHNLTHVINFGFPQELESYVHRIGRTGRAGIKGIAATLIDPKFLFRLRPLENLIKNKIKLCNLPSALDLKKSMVKKELDKMSTVVEAVIEKGENFKVDDTFESFKNQFKGMNQDEILKVLFTWQFNKTLRRYDELDVLNVDCNFKSNNYKDKDFKNTKTNAKNNVRLFMNVGKNHGLRLAQFIDDFSRQSGIKKNQIQNIDLKQNFSFLEIPNNYGDKIVGKNVFNFKNKKVNFEYSNDINSKKRRY
jgi:ATP-dependent RNA helicase DeaD